MIQIREKLSESIHEELKTSQTLPMARTGPSGLHVNIVQGKPLRTEVNWVQWTHTV